MIPDLSERVLETELMDDPALDPREHGRALRALRLVNRASSTASVLWRPIHALASTPGHGPVSILDIATGSGDIPIRLDRLARKAGVSLTIEACDISERALAVAEARARSADAQVRFFRHDAIRDAIPGDYDVVMCSLFMHHLEAAEAIELLYRMKAAARRMMLVSDLRRCKRGYILALLASRLFTASRVARTDALLSVKAAFTIQEFRWLADEAGLGDATILPRRPCRFLLEWKRS